jgi:hypothetical protein
MKTLRCFLLIWLLFLFTTSQVLAEGNDQYGPSAEMLLGNLARAKKSERIVGGLTCTVIGIGTGLLVSRIESEGSFIEREIENSKTIGYIGAGIMGVTGVMLLALPSEVENQYKDVRRIDDPVVRESAAYSSLIFCAEKAKTQRMISAASSAGGALFFLLFNPNDYEGNYNKYTGLSLAAGAVSNFFIKSTEEKMLEQYERGRGYANERKNPPQLRMDWLSNGSVAAVWSYQF